jgi:uncharacterized delta-60 repeat protein
VKHEKEESMRKRMAFFPLAVLFALAAMAGFAGAATVFPNGAFGELAAFTDEVRDFGQFSWEQRAFTSPEYARAMDRRLFGSDALSIGNRLTQAESEETCIQQQEVMPEGLHSGVSREWVRRYAKKGMAEDNAVGLVVDASGNTYVTGTSKGLGTDTDIATIKYDPGGKVLWTRRYNGPANGNDVATAIAVDGNGNVYVSGNSSGGCSSSDYTILKYDPEGKLLWQNHYNGLGNGLDSATAIAVDGNGNVYVTGNSYGGSSLADYATLKYTPGGYLLWEKRYNGPGNGDDYATAIAVDGKGNVYITGKSRGKGSGFDYATLKYAPNGKLLWKNRYNGSASLDDFALAIAVDDSGNVYVTGEAHTTGTFENAKVYATIKYDPKGKLLWEKDYYGAYGWAGATAIAVDGNGNVYVTGQSGFYYYETVKYDPEGTLLWEKAHFVPVHGYGDSVATAIAVDGSGNVFVTGRSSGGSSSNDYATLKYDPEGTLLWENRYNGPGNGDDLATAIAVDGNGNVYVTGTSYGGSTSSDYATLKYDPEGKVVWENRYNGPGNSVADSATAITVDGNGNVYVTGWSDGGSSSNDYATLKYDPEGKLLWKNRYNGPGNGWDEATAIAVDGNGNVYVTGSSSGSSSGVDYATLKYGPDGTLLWEKRYNGPANGEDHATAMAVDGNGNVYVTGDSSRGNSLADYATLKYDPEGTLLWEKRYNGPANGEGYATAMAVDGNGNVYVTGWLFTTGDNLRVDYATVKYSPEGELLWENRYNEPGDSESYATAIAVDGKGNVYATGYTFVVSGPPIEVEVRNGKGNVYVTKIPGPTGYESDYLTLKYGPDGNLLWKNRYNGPANGEDYATAIAVDGNGNVLVTGESSGGNSGVDYATLKYGPDGTLLWEKLYNGPANGRDEATAMAVDGNGNVYVTGESSGGYATTLKYHPDGNLLWEKRYNGPRNSYDSATAIAVDGNGNVYVTGQSNGDYLTIKYSQ